nr:UDP-N-acetyl-D-glucosamine 6-dehydrogenase [Chlamydiota bacterium]
KVIGFDVDETKIQAINQGKSYIKHIDNNRLMAVHDKQLLFATTDFQRVAECDALIICVPTPLDHHLDPDLRYVVETCEAFAPYLQPHTLVSLESTTWPGTTDEVVKPILEAKGKRKLGHDLYLSYSPEREDPGNKLFGTKNIPKLVGGADQESLNLAVAFYSLAIQKVVPLSSTKVAECAKLFENIFRSVNIALVNELKVICDRMGIDVWEIIKAAGTKPFGFMSFSPGPGLGGHCIPIDPFYLTWKAKEYGIRTRFIELAGEINRSMPRFVVSKVQDCLNNYGKAVKGSRILIIGLAYKSDIDDIRESPSLKLIKLLEEKGAIVGYHDPYIPEIGKTREYGHLAGRKHQELSDNYDCFLVATFHSNFSKEKILSYGVPVVDTRNSFSKHEHVYPA